MMPDGLVDQTNLISGELVIDKGCDFFLKFTRVYYTLNERLTMLYIDLNRKELGGF